MTTDQKPAQRLIKVGDVLDAINSIISPAISEEIATHALAKWAQVGKWKTIKITLRLKEDGDAFSYDTTLSREPHRKPRSVKAHGGRVKR